ncbi:hypothetical protein [Epilithonimonas sp. UC225_85]|uniref:hypothetical protein n=1 Tax=Epilithonimonas sp. UC225_85 TaxID=3350167 RepID=UPI0036D2EF09
MKKTISSVLILGCISYAYTQVGIGTSNPALTMSIKDNSTGIQHHSSNKISIVSNSTNAITVDQANVGINNVNPTKILDVDAGNNFLRISNLLSVPNPNPFLPYPLKQNPLNGESGYIDDANVYVGGQVMRIVVKPDVNIAGNSFSLVETPVRFEFNPQSATPDAPAATPNYINNITGSSFLYGQSLAAGNGTLARTTDQIQLPAGVYRITLKLVSNFTGHHKNNSIDIKLSVNNGEYSFANGVNYGDGNQLKTGYFTETVNLSSPSKLDFIYVKQTGPNSTSSQSNLSPYYSDNVMRSIILIERLK